MTFFLYLSNQFVSSQAMYIAVKQYMFPYRFCLRFYFIMAKVSDQILNFDKDNFKNDKMLF